MTDEQTRRLEAAVIALLLLWEGRNALALRLTLLVLFKQITEQLRDLEQLPAEPNDLLDPMTWRGEINTTQETYWRGAVVAGLALMASFIWTAIGKTSKPPQSIDDLGPQLRAAFAQWLAERRYVAWQHVMKSAAKRVAKAVEAARVAGLTPAEAAKLIAEEAKKWAETGANVMATTEMNAARNFGFQLGRQSAELQGKVWRNPLDKRTRRPNKKGKGKYDHWKPNGQIRRENDAFTVSGESLMFPGDMSLGATIGNVANCRCWTIPYFGKIP